MHKSYVLCDLTNSFKLSTILVHSTQWHMQLLSGQHSLNFSHLIKHLVRNILCVFAVCTLLIIFIHVYRNPTKKEHHPWHKKEPVDYYFVYFFYLSTHPEYDYPLGLIKFVIVNTLRWQIIETVIEQISQTEVLQSLKTNFISCSLVPHPTKVWDWQC